MVFNVLGFKSIPVFGIATTLSLLVSICVFLALVPKALSLITEQLVQRENFTAPMMKPLENHALVCSAMATLALCVGILALIVDFVNCNTRYEDVESGRFCEGLTPCFMVSVTDYVVWSSKS